VTTTLTVTMVRAPYSQRWLPDDCRSALSLAQARQSGSIPRPWHYLIILATTRLALSMLRVGPLAETLLPIDGHPVRRRVLLQANADALSATGWECPFPTRVGDYPVLDAV
jgi:hypothetical protein